MRKMTYERHITDTNPPTKGMSREGAQLTKIRPGMLGFVCEICGLPFERNASAAKRHRTSFCSVACFHESMRVRIETPCIICGNKMSLQPSQIGKKVTCSKECSTRRRISLGKKGKITPSVFAEYKRAAASIKTREICCNCKRTTGPWVVRNLEITVPDTGPVAVNASAAELWCKKCHLCDCAPLGAPARKWRPKSSNAK